MRRAHFAFAGLSLMITVGGDQKHDLFRESMTNRRFADIAGSNVHDVTLQKLSAATGNVY
jgi:hypothetical protein